MTTETKNWLKNNLTTWLTLGNMILLLGLAYGRGSFEAQMQRDIQQNKERGIENAIKIGTHSIDPVMHKTSDELNVKFVPRKELEVQLEYIMKTQDEIKALIKKN